MRNPQSLLSGRRVLFIVENLPVPFDTRPWLEAQALKEAGMEVAIICPRGKGYEAPYEFLKGIHIYRHPFPIEAGRAMEYLLEYGLSLFWEFFYSLKIFRKMRFEVIHVANPPDLLCLIGLAYKWLGVRFVYDQHDICPEVMEAKFGKKGILYKALVFWERVSYWAADLVVATNESYRDLAIERGQVNPRKVSVVRTGPDLSRIPSEVKKDDSLKKGKRFMVGYVGVIEKQEGLDYLVQVVKEIVQGFQRQDILFMIVGGGTQVPFIQGLVKKEGLEDFFHFTGRVSDEILFNCLGNCEVCVNPDLFNEASNRSTMRKIMEYMALGKAMVQTEVIEGRYTAQEASLYARPDDQKDFAEKILYLLDHPEEAKRRGLIGKKRIHESLHWGVQKQNLITAYENLFKKLIV
ncbi:MAG: glycosyltransferase family 4 protein [Deltaproteobacteria bacterium]|nr:glycosyltransferase family 4 protein [Deltaproteobacteria bacterium]